MEKENDIDLPFIDITNLGILIYYKYKNKNIVINKK